VTYHVAVERAGEGNEVSLRVDGHLVEGNIVPLPPVGQAEVVVKAILGGGRGSSRG
jgi:hypothetical protein